jgi:hypothetical protein
MIDTFLSQAKKFAKTNLLCKVAAGGPHRESANRCCTQNSTDVDISSQQRPLRKSLPFGFAPSPIRQKYFLFNSHPPSAVFVSVPEKVPITTPQKAFLAGRVQQLFSSTYFFSHLSLDFAWWIVAGREL